MHLVLETSYIYLKGQLDPPVSNSHAFAPMEVSWISLLVTSRFCTKGGQLDPPVGLGLAGRIQLKNLGSFGGCPLSKAR